MTGHGSGSARVGPATVVVEIRAVNHRFLDVRARLPGPLAEHAPAAEDVVRRTLERGHVELSGRLEGAFGGEVVLDRARARAALAQLGALRDEVSPSEPIPLSLLAVVPDLFGQQAGVAPEQVREAVAEAAVAACTAVSAMREVEGRALASDLLGRVARVETLAETLAAHTDDLSNRVRARMQERVAVLLEGSAVALDRGRLEHEVVLLADRADVSEELTRLRSHCGQVRTAVAQQGPVGRRLEFLLQELGREVNTLGSKVAELDVTAAVVELKVELERMREQVQNVL